MINSDLLRHMRSDAYLVNTSRGGLVDEDALVDALKNKIIAGAGLDVLNSESEIKNNPLSKMENVILTPHAAFSSAESTQELREKVMHDVIAVLTGKQPKYQLNNV